MDGTNWVCLKPWTLLFGGAAHNLRLYFPELPHQCESSVGETARCHQPTSTTTLEALLVRVQLPGCGEGVNWSEADALEMLSSRRLYADFSEEKACKRGLQAELYASVCWISQGRHRCWLKLTCQCKYGFHI